MEPGSDNQLSLTHHFAQTTAASDAHTHSTMLSVIYLLHGADRQSTVYLMRLSIFTHPARVSNIDLVQLARSRTRRPVDYYRRHTSASPISDERYAQRVMPSFPRWSAAAVPVASARCFGEFMLPLILTGNGRVAVFVCGRAYACTHIQPAYVRFACEQGFDTRSAPKSMRGVADGGKSEHTRKWIE